MKYITTKEAAEHWGVSLRTVQSWITNGKISDAEKIGRDWMIPADTQRPYDRRYVENPVRNRRKKEPR